jgi:hypothetical protein
MFIAACSYLAQAMWVAEFNSGCFVQQFASVGSRVQLEEQQLCSSNDEPHNREILTKYIPLASALITRYELNH